MFRRKTLKRLTRLGLCLYVFVYCMALTVCAEPYPVQEVNEQNVFSPDAAAGVSWPGGINVTFDGNTTWELSQLISNYTDALQSGTPVNVILTRNLVLERGQVRVLMDDSATSPMYLSINGNGHKIQGKENTVSLFYSPTHRQMMNLIISDCTLSGSDSAHGAAVNASVNNSITLRNVIFEGNNASYGGAVCLNNSYGDCPASLTIRNCTFRNNTAEDRGGAVYIEGNRTTVSIRDSYFYGNRAENYGGAIYAGRRTGDDSGEIRNCVFNANSAGDAGAVYDLSGAFPHLDRNAFFMNSVDSRGVTTLLSHAERFAVSNSVFFGNTGGEDMIADIDSPRNLGSDANGSEEAEDGAFDIGANWYGNTAGNYSLAPVVNGTEPDSWYWLNLTDGQFEESYGVEVDFRNLYWGNLSAAHYHNASENVGEDCGLAAFTLNCALEGAVRKNQTIKINNGYGVVTFAEKPKGPFNLTLSVPGTDEIILTKEFEGFAPDEGNTDEGNTDESNAVTVNKTFGDLDLPVTYNMTIPYTGIKLKPKNIKETEKFVYSIEDLTILLSSLTDPAFLDRTVPRFKFYNSKNVIPAGKKKQSYFTITLTPDPKLQKEEKKEVKKRLKNINKDLKKEKFVFAIEPLDLAAAENPALQWNKKGTKVPKVTASWKGRSHVLKQKKDYTAEIKDKEVKLTGKGNFAGERVMAR